MLSSSSSKFDLLPARPPTPPREVSNAIDDAISFLDDSNEVDRLLNQRRTVQESVNLATEHSPALYRDIDGASNASRKVGFSPHPIYYKPAQPDQASSPSNRIDKKSPSRRSVEPLKSILKRANAQAPPTPDDLESKLSYFSPEIPGSFAKMLQSVIQQLAGSSRSSRLDAYLALNGVLKTYEDVPDTEAMNQKMGLFMQFITRDLVWKNPEGSLDVNIITQALKLAISILFHSKLAEALDDDFKTFLVERSISVLEIPDMPKAIVKTHLYVLTQQRFRSQIMTNGRADKLLTALQSIEDRCSGNSVIASRLVVYQRLCEQVPGVMLTRMREWLEHVFHGMLSSVKDVRTRAIDTCRQIGLVFGQQPHAGKALHDLFETEVEEGQTYCSFLVWRLGEMMIEKEGGAYVPQIWSSIILFFRSKRTPPEKWPLFKSWLAIIQKCLNSSDITIRYQALLAWNKLVFATMPDSSTSKAMMGMLKVPICSGVEKLGVDKFSQRVRQYAYESYYNLLHYAMRPGLSNEEHDNAWDTFVTPVLSEISKSSGKGRYTACRVLHGLLNGNVGVWNARIAIDQAVIKPEELPKLDPRWVRSRLGKVLALLEPLISTGMSLSAESNAALDAVWYSLMHSVAEAGNQEVRTSSDLKQAIAVLVSMFRRLWYDYGKKQQEADEGRWLKRYVTLIEMMVGSLGSGPFVEDILSTGADNVIEVAPTPSHRHSKPNGTPQSPLLILIGLFYSPPGALPIDDKYQDAAFSVLKRLTSSKLGMQPRLDVLCRNMYAWSHMPNFAADPSVQKQLWIAIARNAMLVFTTTSSDTSGSDSQSLGHGFRSAVDILVAGLEIPESEEACDVHEELYDALFDSARAYSGDGGIVLAVVEPFAKALSSASSSVGFSLQLRLASYVLGKAPWPRTRQSLDHARKSLWGAGLTPHKSTTFDPFEHTYTMIENLTTTAYDCLETVGKKELDLVRKFFSSVIDFLDKSPLSLLGLAFRKVQNGFALWIEDSTRKTGVDRDMSDFIRISWSRIIQFLDRLPGKDSTLLKAFESLLVAGFSSPHKAVVNATILFWNSTFGNHESLTYPPKLAKVLRARVVDADIRLPTFPNTNGESIPASLPSFFDFENESPPESPLQKRNDGRWTTHLSASSPAARSPYFKISKSPIGWQTSLSSPVRRVVRSSASSTPKPRLRHDDSQIQFAPIDSSPLPPADDSQILTEHQKEVKARQIENSNLFPDLSSSPLAQSTALTKAVSKRLNFTSNAVHQNTNEDPGTPTGLPEAQGLMSDDLPSSPTPSSTKDVVQNATRGEDEQELDDALNDPPSSPPRGHLDNDDWLDENLEGQTSNLRKTIEPGKMNVEITDGSMAQSEDHLPQKEPQMPATITSIELEPQTEHPASPFPSDSRLPTMQLQLEEEAASFQLENVADITTVSMKESDGPAATTDQEERKSNPADSPGREVTRVEDSFLEPNLVDTARESQSQNSSQPSQRGGKKRQRSRQTVYTAKRRKQESFFKRSMSSVSAQDWQDTDDDIGEEIVVASSQRSSSPVVSMSQEASSSESKPDNVAAGPDGDSIDISKAPPAKRGRGRPRKSETLASTHAELKPAKTLKRKASALSNASSMDSPSSSSFIKATQTPTKYRKRDSEYDVKQVSASRSSEAQGQLDQAARKRSPIVVVEATTVGTITPRRSSFRDDEVYHSDSDDDNFATPSKQLASEDAAATPPRPIATPRSILRRLRDALTDFKGMILGSQEEREYDDVLFEFRREAHEAGRRGREQDA